MKRIVLQVLFAIAGLLMFFRFGGPALIFGATGPGPFGNRWLEKGMAATLLLDGVWNLKVRPKASDNQI